MPEPGHDSDGKPKPTPGTPAGTRIAPRADRAALAQVTDGIAPALNELLTVVVGQSHALLDSSALEPASREVVSQIYAAGEKAAHLVRQLQLFSGHGRMHPHLLDLNALLADNASVLRRLTGSQVDLVLTPGDALPSIVGDADMLEHVLFGLVANARSAMPGGGRITISTEAVTVDTDSARRFPEGRPGTFVMLAVADNGCGIARDYLPFLFKPFYTTQPANRLAGLGLATSSGIVSQHGGWMTAESELGAGSTFRAYLPAATTAVDTATVPPSARETILLVDDDPAVRELTAAFLQNDGYRVLQASTALDALEAWKWHGARIALLLTDIVLEGRMNGLELARTLQAHKPELGVIFTSGHGRDIMEETGALSDRCRFLAKPCRPETLRRTVRALLPRPSP